jgi:hypothetical protein
MTARPRPEPRPVYVLTLRAEPHVADTTGALGIHALRHLLKILLRRYRFRCLDLREDVSQSFSKNRTGRAAGKQKDDDNDVST